MKWGAYGHTWSPLSGRASPSLPRPHLSFNEPLSICELGYSVGVFAPGVKGGPAGQYKCGHNLLLAHAKAVKLYREKYLKTQGGKLSMALDGKWGYPYDPSSKAGASRAVAWQGVSSSIIPVLRCTRCAAMVKVTSHSITAGGRAGNLVLLTPRRPGGRTELGGVLLRLDGR